MPKSFRAKVTAIEESKDLDDIKVQELVGSLQTYEMSLPNQRKSKYLTLKTINEKVEDGWTSVGDLHHPIKYVHEVQQALRFCSVEKEIKL